jgi:hypothetical protein
MLLIGLRCPNNSNSSALRPDPRLGKCPPMGRSPKDTTTILTAKKRLMAPLDIGKKDACFGVETAIGDR